MQIIVDEVDHAFYADLIITPRELDKLYQGDTITGNVTFKRRACYAGIRLQGVWDHGFEEDKKRKESVQSDERIRPRRTSQRIKKGANGDIA